jgi:hypothetical protein
VIQRGQVKGGFSRNEYEYVFTQRKGVVERHNVGLTGRGLCFQMDRQDALLKRCQF